ncbi:hypothetical protein D9M69_661180 [compost metagenome]
MRAHARFGDHLVLVVCEDAGHQNDERSDDRRKVVRRQKPEEFLFPEIEGMSGRHKITPVASEGYETTGMIPNWY